MISSQAPDEALQWPGRLRQIRSDLTGLCRRIADVEDAVAATASEIAARVPGERAERLLAHASAAREYAATRRALARGYEE